MNVINNVFLKINNSISFAVQSLKCKVCGEYHQGIDSANVCRDCYSKGHR